MQSVLVVDDSLTVRMDLTQALEAASFRVIACATAADARTAWSKEPIELAILDVILPDGDGLELLKELRATSSQAGIGVLLLSTEAEIGDRIRGLQTGADDYVGKPYDTNYVVARARDLLQKRAPVPATDEASILVIDDSATFREELRRALEAAGYSVSTAASGEEGLRLVASQRPTAVIVDGVMPGIDGGTVVRRIRLDAALRGTPCVLLTAMEDREAELRALDAGADAFVRKQDDLEVILARLAAVLRSAARTQPSTSSLLGPKRVLAVDDSLTYLQELAEALRGEGYDVILARSGEEAIDILAVQSADCILLDLVMPGIGGKETCKRIKASSVLREVPLILITARDERESMIEGLGAGADDYIPKSSEFEVLKARVRAQIRRRQFEDEHRKIREDLLRSELEAAEARAQRKIAETKAALADELERKNKELEAFSYSVSHDLRAPLRGIDGFSQALLEDYADELDARGRDYLGRVRSATQRMGTLIDDLLNLSRTSRAALVRERVDLSRVAAAVIAELEQKDPGRRVEFAAAPELWVEADSGLMRALLDNLIGNAWKFTAKAAAPHVEVGVKDEGTERVYFVRDNGAGFDMAYAKRLFAPFQRLHAESEFPGTGIGLATVHRIVDRHGGRVWAEAAVGAGATIYFTLPPQRSGGTR